MCRNAWSVEQTIGFFGGPVTPLGCRHQRRRVISKPEVVITGDHAFAGMTKYRIIRPSARLALGDRTQKKHRGVILKRQPCENVGRILPAPPTQQRFQASRLRPDFSVQIAGADAKHARALISKRVW